MLPLARSTRLSDAGDRWGPFAPRGVKDSMVGSRWATFQQQDAHEFLIALGEQGDGEVLRAQAAVGRGAGVLMAPQKPAPAAAAGAAGGSTGAAAEGSRGVAAMGRAVAEEEGGGMQGQGAQGHDGVLAPSNKGPKPTTPTNSGAGANTSAPAQLAAGASTSNDLTGAARDQLAAAAAACSRPVSPAPQPPPPAHIPFSAVLAPAARSFSGCLRNTYVCSACGHSSCVREPFTCLSLQMPGAWRTAEDGKPLVKHSLMELLDNHFKVGWLGWLVG